ncbi:hypothetical protein ES703_08214 [subsurface metagenome]
MTAREVTHCLTEIDDYFQEFTKRPNSYSEKWAEAIIEAIEIIKDSKYWPDK